MNKTKQQFHNKWIFINFANSNNFSRSLDCNIASRKNWNVESPHSRYTSPIYDATCKNRKKQLKDGMCRKVQLSCRCMYIIHDSATYNIISLIISLHILTCISITRHFNSSSLVTYLIKSICPEAIGVFTYLKSSKLLRLAPHQLYPDRCRKHCLCTRSSKLRHALGPELKQQRKTIETWMQQPMAYSTEIFKKGFPSSVPRECPVDCAWWWMCRFPV